MLLCRARLEPFSRQKLRRRPARLRTVRAALYLGGKNNEWDMATGVVVLEKLVSSESYQTTNARPNEKHSYSKITLSAPERLPTLFIS